MNLDISEAPVEGWEGIVVNASRCVDGCRAIGCGRAGESGLETDTDGNESRDTSGDARRWEVEASFVSITKYCGIGFPWRLLALQV